jgi:hypothetical protein
MTRVKGQYHGIFLLFNFTALTKSFLHSVAHMPRLFDTHNVSAKSELRWTKKNNPNKKQLSGIFNIAECWSSDSAEVLKKLFAACKAIL